MNLCIFLKQLVYEMKNLILIKVLRTNDNAVKVIYYHNSRHQEFMIEWNNINEESGCVVDYSLQTNCMSSSDNLNEIINNCIKLGESEDNKNVDSYLELRDTFNSNDCENI